MEDVEVGLARFVGNNLFVAERSLQSCVVVVSGPDADGDIVLLAGAETYLPRETAFNLANEILLRLKESE